MKKLLLSMGLTMAMVAVSAYLPMSADAQCDYYGGGYSYYSSSSGRTGSGPWGYSSYFEKRPSLAQRSEIYYERRPGASQVVTTAMPRRARMEAARQAVNYPGDVRGWDIYNDRGARLGRVDRVIMSGNHPDYVLFSGDFDGGSGRMYPVPWNRVNRVDRDRLYMNMDANSFRNAPSYQADRLPDFNKARWDNDVRNYYRQSAQGTGRERTQRELIDRSGRSDVKARTTTGAESKDRVNRQEVDKAKKQESAQQNREKTDRRDMNQSKEKVQDNKAATQRDQQRAVDRNKADNANVKEKKSTDQSSQTLQSPAFQRSAPSSSQSAPSEQNQRSDKNKENPSRSGSSTDKNNTEK